MYDAVIIGSGIGGLTCGAFLSRAGMRVLVLERHVTIGGYAHMFRRRSFIFDSGIHSVPMAEGGVVRRMLSRLRIDHLIKTIEHPSMFDLRAPGGDFSMPGTEDAILEHLHTCFPSERDSLARLLESAHRIREVVQGADYDFEEGFIANNREFVDRYHNRPFNSFIEELTTEPRLRRIFRAMWPYVGMPAERAATVFYFMMFSSHLIEGSHYVRGGFASLATALRTAITDGGGAVLTRHEVVSLETEGRDVRAAVTADGQRHEGKLFIANCSPYVLHRRLIPESSRSRRWLRRLSGLQPSLSTVGVYLGVTPRIRERHPSNLTFWYASEDHNATYEGIMENGSLEPNHLVLLQPAEQVPNPTLLLMQFVSPSASDNWKEDKMRVADRMLERAERIIPGLRGEIQLMEVGSPSTYERYTLNTGGALYGFENTSSLYGEARMPTRTHLHNLFQTGHWQRPGGGIWNVTVNGYAVAQRILRSLA